MEQNTPETFEQKAAPLLAKIAHAEDMLDLIDVSLERIELDINQLLSAIEKAKQKTQQDSTYKTSE